MCKSDGASEPDRLYNLFAVIVHIGGGPHHGHYVTLIKSMDQWILFDDDNVEPVEEADLQRYFGDMGTGCGYIFFYQAADFEASSVVRGNAPVPPDFSETATVGSVVTASPHLTPAATNTTQTSYFTEVAHSSPSATPATSPLAHPSLPMPVETKKEKKSEHGAFGLNWSLPGFGKKKKDAS
jgi:ubiquitin carboxyl-terminal hydrolase 9/13